MYIDATSNIYVSDRQASTTHILTSAHPNSLSNTLFCMVHDTTAAAAQHPLRTHSLYTVCSKATSFSDNIPAEEVF